MPTYDYTCTECGARFSVFHSMSATPPATCADLRAFPDVEGVWATPDCAGPVVREVTGGTGLIFKGSGFYITDYKGDAAKKDAGDGAKKDAGGDAKPADAKPGETKPAEKTEAKPAASESAPASAPKSESPAPAKPASEGKTPPSKT